MPLNRPLDEKFCEKLKRELYDMLYSGIKKPN
jgi:hypothetical protein